jgi:hypothetical protein
MNPKKIALTFMAMVVLFAGIAVADAYKASSKAGVFDVALTIDKNPPIVGKNNATIAIKDSTGQPVTDASVRLEYSMSAMSGMPPMKYKADAVQSDGVYNSPLNLSMAGPWLLNVKVLRDKKMATAKFSVDVQ